MASLSFAVFDTPIGRCAITWGPRGIVAVQLPEAHEAGTRARVLKQFADASEAPPPADVRQAIDGLVALLSGERTDLSDVVLDMDGLPTFYRRVYEAARTIPPGTTRSYGEVAAGIGSPGAARAVGQALGRNPFALVVPCHRVLAAGGKIGGFSAHGSIETKRRLLDAEQGLEAGGWRLGTRGC